MRNHFEGTMDPSTSYYHDLRSANGARNIAWTNGAGVDLTWRAAELAGEAAELSELLLLGDRIPRQEHARRIWEEIGDVVICVDLAAMSAGIPEFTIGQLRPEPFYPVERAAILGMDVGLACNALKKMERERRGWPGSRATANDLFPYLSRVLMNCHQIARFYHVDVDLAVRTKFNETSRKVGLPVFLA
jgi:hypothetical protein